MPITISIQFSIDSGDISLIHTMEGDHQNNCEYLDEYRIIRTLGSGYSAEVKLAVDSEGKYVAIKKYKHDTATLDTLKDELKVMKDLNHQNLIKLIAVKEKALLKRPKGSSQDCYAIVLEYAGGGQLFDFIAQTGKFSQKVTRTYFHEMMNGIHYMHDKGYAHRDIKPENLLLASNFTLKLADFGFSCLIKGHSGTGVLKTKLGTEGYMAPEIALKSYDGRKTDIFAAGVILFIMYAGNPPFEKATPTDPYYKLIKEKRYDIFWSAHSRKRLPTYFSDTFKDLVQKMIAYAPNERPTIQEISKHAWVKGSACLHPDIVLEFTQRKKKLDALLEKKRNQAEYEKHRRNDNIQNQGFNSRDNEGEDHLFIGHYNKQKLKHRELRPLEECSPDDIIVNNPDCAFVISQLKCFLVTHRIPLERETTEEEEDLIVVSPLELKCQEVSDVGDKIRAKYKYQIEVQGQSFDSWLIFTAQLGLRSPNELALHLQLQQGSGFYLKLVSRDLRANCFP